MRIGIVDTEGKFNDKYFQNKNLKIIEFNKNCATNNLEQICKSRFTHSEQVSAVIFKENPSCKLKLVPTINKNRKCSSGDLIHSMQLLLEDGVDIISLSVGIERTNYYELQYFCEEITKKGIVLVAAYNNQGKVTYPAEYKNVIGVTHNKNTNENIILEYKKEKNIVFFSPYVYLGQFERTGLVQGNSFSCALLSGYLSNYKNTGQLHKMEKNLLSLNKLKRMDVNTFNSYEQKNKIFICNNNETKQLIGKPLKNTEIIALEEYLNQYNKYHKKSNFIIVYNDDFQHFKMYKEQLKNILQDGLAKECDIFLKNLVFSYFELTLMLKLKGSSSLFI